MTGIRIKVPAVLCALATAFAVCVTPTASAEAATCPRGKFCLFKGKDQAGVMEEFAKYYTDLRNSDVGYKSMSWWNRSGFEWYVFSEPHCSGEQHPLHAGDSDDVSPHWTDRIKSVARQGMFEECRT